MTKDRRKNAVASLTLVMILGACHSKPAANEQSAALSSVAATAPVVKEVAGPADSNQAGPQKLNADSFECVGFTPGKPQQIIITDIEPSGDHEGPIGSYKIVSKDEYNGASGNIRLSGDDYEFIDGPLGRGKAKIVMDQHDNQFFTFIIGNQGASCNHP